MKFKNETKQQKGLKKKKHVFIWSFSSAQSLMTSISFQFCITSFLVSIFACISSVAIARESYVRLVIDLI